MSNKCQIIAYPIPKSANVKTVNNTLTLNLTINVIGCLIGSSLNPNSYPAKQSFSVTSTLASETGMNISTLTRIVLNKEIRLMENGKQKWKKVLI